MSTNLITTDIQALEIPDGILDLFELEYSDSTTLYFHPGVDSTVRVTSISGAVIKLNRPQTFTDDAQLTFTGLDNEDGVSYTITADVNGAVGTGAYSVTVDNISSNTPSGGRTGGIAVGMIVTGSDIDDDGFGPIVFDGNTYYGFPIIMDGLEIANDGAMGRPNLTIANVESLLLTGSTFQNAFSSTAAEGGAKPGISNFKLNNLIGKRLTRRRTLEKYLNIDPATSATKAAIEFPKSIHIIDRIANKTNIMVNIELSVPFDLAGVRVPRREVVGKYCSWIYKGLKESVSGSDLAGAVSVASNGGTTVVGEGTAFDGTGTNTGDFKVGDEILIGGKYLRTITAIASDTSLTVNLGLPEISTDGSAATDKEPGRLTYKKYTPKNIGACSWNLNGRLTTYVSANQNFNFYFTQNDEPIIFKGVTHTYSGGTYTKRTSSNPVNGLFPKQWSGTSTPATSVTLAKNDIVFTAFDRDNNDELYWIYLGASGTVNTFPAIGSSLWQLIRLYTLWSNKTYAVNSNDSLRNEYVIYPFANWSTESSIILADTSTIWRNTRTIATANNEVPEANSLFWEPGDSCGKLLKSCKSRYQAKPHNSAGTLKNTVPSVDKDTGRLLPFGGFPGSRKFR